MCRWDLKAEKLSNRLLVKTVESSFPAEFINSFPPNRLLPSHCLICSRPLSNAEMYPSGKTPRYMCKTCYEFAAYESPKELCILWGKPLPNYLVRERRKNPRELENAFCNNVCGDYWTVLVGRVFGYKFNINHSQPSSPPEHLIKLPCSTAPEPATILPHFNEFAQTSQGGLFLEYRFKMIKVR